LSKFRKERNIKERNSIEIDYFYSLEEHRNVERKKFNGMRPTKKNLFSGGEIWVLKDAYFDFSNYTHVY
jgi:hypothetical protein